MLISLDWIKDFVELPELPPHELASRFTLASAEVEDVKTIGEFWKQIKVAQILSFEKHPEADKLNLVTFTIGEIGDGEKTQNIRRVVCGASNVREGIKIPFAPIGTTLPGGFTLEAKKIRGILSEGMLCSEEELGLKEKSEGIMELPNDAPVGMTLLEYFNKTVDVVIDVDNKSLTHRPDLWGHYGLAREFAAIFETELKNPFDESWQKKLQDKIQEKKIGNKESPVTIEVHPNSSCLGYFGLSIDGIRVGESPEFIKRRLEVAGLRAINNIVDISNYVMLELGMPLHIFDREKIADSKIKIYPLSENNGETKFITLDEVERILMPGDTVIGNSREPLVLAGIMGGLNSGVDQNTTKIFIEVANWQAAKVRQTSTRLGLRTDSSMRYEKSLDSELLMRTLLRTLELILEQNKEAYPVGKIEYRGPTLSDYKPLVIHCEAQKIANILGCELTHEKITKILTSLDFKVHFEKDNNFFKVEVPSYRATKDIECEADIVEELGRIIGYDNIEPRAPYTQVVPVKLTPEQKMTRSFRDFLVLKAQALEAMTYPMIGEDLLKKVAWEKSAIPLILKNALSEDHALMRESLIPSLIQTAALNAKNFDDFRFFELGRTYNHDDTNFAKESKILALAFYSKSKSLFNQLASLTLELLEAHNIPSNLCGPGNQFPNSLIATHWPGVHPHEFYNIRIMGKMLGVINTVHPIVMRNMKMRGHLSFMLLDYTNIAEVATRDRDKVKYKPIPKFPSSSFDWTVIVPKETPIAEVLTPLKKVKIKELKSLKIVAVFPKENEQAVTLSAVFLDPSRTLEGEFLTESSRELIKIWDTAGFPLKMA